MAGIPPCSPSQFGDMTLHRHLIWLSLEPSWLASWRLVVFFWHLVHDIHTTKAQRKNWPSWFKGYPIAIFFLLVCRAPVTGLSDVHNFSRLQTSCLGEHHGEWPGPFSCRDTQTKEGCHRKERRKPRIEKKALRRRPNMEEWPEQECLAPQLVITHL